MLLIALFILVASGISVSQGETDNITKLCKENPKNIACGIDENNEKILEIRENLPKEAERKGFDKYFCNRYHLNNMSNYEKNFLMKTANDYRNKMAGGQYTHAVTNQLWPTASHMFELVSWRFSYC